MDANTIFIETLKFAGVVLASGFISNKLQRRKLKSESFKTESEAGAIIVNSSIDLVTELRIQLDLHGKQIKKLEEEINKLKNQEKKHNLERDVLRRRIFELINENEQLRRLDKENSAEIFKLKTRIKELELKLE